MTVQNITNENLRLKEAAKYLGVSLTTLWRIFETDTDAPPKIRITSRCCVVRKRDLDLYLSKKQEA